jgi:hypothetical protein
MDNLTYNQKIRKAGINIIRTNTRLLDRKLVFMEYKGKRIRRPMQPSEAVELIKEEFGLEI